MTGPVRSQWIDIAPGYAGYLALPPARRGPGLLVLQEIFGVNEHIRAVAAPFHSAGHDEHIAPQAVAAVREATQKALGPERAEVFVYDAAHHGFNCWARASYHAPSAALAHGRCLEFPARQLF